MKAFRSILLFGVIFFLLSAPAAAADTKIGIVDFQQAMSESEAGKAIQAKVQNTGRDMESKLKALESEILELEKTLKNNSQTKNLSDSKVEEIQRQMGTKATDFKIMQKKFQSEMQELQSRYLEKIQSELFKVVESIGKKDGYLLVIEKTAAIYYPDTIDITAAVVKAYDAQFDGKLD